MTDGIKTNADDAANPLKGEAPAPDEVQDDTPEDSTQALLRIPMATRNGRPVQVNIRRPRPACSTPTFPTQMAVMDK